jgi:hypothetical protein
MNRAGTGIRSALRHRPQATPKLGRSLPEKSARYLPKYRVRNERGKLFAMTGVMY